MSTPATPDPAPPPLLEMRGIEKSFAGVRALRGVDLELYTGEIHALIGENGAGKSTLIKVLSGAHRPDAGTIRIDGRETDFRDPAAAQRAGITVIYQEFNLIPSLTARENIFLGRELTTAGFLRARREERGAREIFARLGASINPGIPCRRLSIAQQQTVEIAKALVSKARILVLDEPTATLTPPEARRLFSILGDLQKLGLGIIYISHRLEEVLALAARFTVLRDGSRVAAGNILETTRETLIEAMVGRRLDLEFPGREAEIGGERLAVKDLRRGSKVRGVSLSIRRGEILGLTGLVGAGRTETARLIFGADRSEGGSISLDGKALDIRGPRDAIRAGIALLSEDRKNQGLVLGRSARENFSLPNLSRWRRWGLLQERLERAAFADHAGKLGIRPAHPDLVVRNLSGGNQQKVVLARWLERHCEAILFDEPTRGIDVGARFEVHAWIHRLAARGKAILMISSELPEILGMCDRILVMRDGRISGEIPDARSATQEEILELAVR